MLRKRASIKGIGGSIFYDATGQADSGPESGAAAPQPEARAADARKPDAQAPAERPRLRILPLAEEPETTVAARKPDVARPEPAPTAPPPVMRATVGAASPAPAPEPPARKEPIPLRPQSPVTPASGQPPVLVAAPARPASVEAPSAVAPAKPAARPGPIIVADAPARAPGPDGTVPPQPAKGGADLKASTPEQEKRAAERLGPGAAKAMLEEVTALYQRVTDVSGARMEMAEWAMDLLSEARDLLLLGGAGDFNQAERKVNEARLILNRIEQSRRWSSTYGWLLLVYQLALFVGFVGAIIFDRSIAAWLAGLAGSAGLGEGAFAMSAIFPPWNTMLWGGIGGIVGALYSLHWHVAELQDFDKQYSLWYVVQPFMGLILGGIVHLIIVTGMLALVPVTGAMDDARIASTAVHWFPSLVACLAGFRQKFAYELLDNVMKAIGRQPAESSARISS